MSKKLNLNTTKGDIMKTITPLMFLILSLFCHTYDALGGDFQSLCTSSKQLDSAVEYHTKDLFPEYINDEFAFSNLKTSTKEYAEFLCSNVGKRAYHGKWHPRPFDMGEITGVTYFKKGQNLGYPGRYAKSADFYYIIYYGAAFVSQCRRVDPR